MVSINGRIAAFSRMALLFVVLAAFGARAARASYLQLIDTGAWVENDRVCLHVEDEGTTHSWKSSVYSSITNLLMTDGVVAFFDTAGGSTRLHTVVYDPGDRKFHSWVSNPSTSYSILSIDSGIVACINGSAGLVQAVAYDPGDRGWHAWASAPMGAVSNFTNKGGVLSCYMNSNRYAVGAAYDMGDKKWHEWIQGPAPLSGIAGLDSNDGVVAMIYGGKTIAKAYDPGDRSWHTWTQSLPTDTNLLNDEAIVAFIHGTSVYGLAYSPGDRDWSEWHTDTKNWITFLSMNTGNIVYLVKETYYSHFMAEAPRAYFVAVRSSNADSLRYQFSDNSVGGIGSWLWTFGDGASSTDRSPMHVYKKAGDFKVTLKVTGVGGSHSSSKTITVPIPAYTLKYLAGSHGSISGTAEQLVKLGANGATVTAVPDKGYHFVKWSDGSTINPRKDLYVAANMTVTASFSNKTASDHWQLMR